MGLDGAKHLVLRHFERETEASFWNRCGFSYRDLRKSSGDPQAERDWVAPYWFLSALFAGLPAMRLNSHRRRRRTRRAGLCPNCGYDLRATPDRCPECGRDFNHCA
jgi:predicted Zn-ribbon and HTH transcriptional regulator